MMEEKILFEKSLFWDGNAITVDIEFYVDRIVMLPKIRPHQLEKAVRLALENWQMVDFRRKILEKIYYCPALIYQLFKRGAVEFGEIEPFLRNRDIFFLCYYFRKEIVDFASFMQNKEKPNDFDCSFLENENDVFQMIEYGFLPSSVEYILKYDVIDDLIGLNNLNHEAKWSPFEWCSKPDCFDLLSFSGFFGSIKCFKHLLIKDFKINEQTLSMIVCSGSLDLFHLFQGEQLLTAECICKASEFFQLPLLVFMIENGANINSKNKIVDLVLLIIVHFILLLKMAILVLLSF